MDLETTDPHHSKDSDTQPNATTDAERRSIADARADESARVIISSRETSTQTSTNLADVSGSTEELRQVVDDLPVETQKKKRKRRKRKKLDPELAVTTSDDVNQTNCDVTTADALSAVPETAKQSNEQTEGKQTVEDAGDHQDNQNDGTKKKRSRRRRRKKSNSQVNTEEKMAERETSPSDLAEVERNDEHEDAAISGNAGSGKKKRKRRRKSKNTGLEESGGKEEGEGMKAFTPPRSPDSALGRGTPRRTPNSSSHRQRPLFEQHWPLERVSDGLKSGELVKGVLRINPRNYELAWVTVPGLKRDVLLEGMLRRNRSLNGDVVALQILPREKWKAMKDEMEYNGVSVGDADYTQCDVNKITKELDKMNLQSPASGVTPHNNVYIDNSKVPEEFLQRTGKVVFIMEKKHSRVACGHLKPFQHPKKSPDGLFSPTDSRLPRLRIPRDLCPLGFFDKPQDFANSLLVARITSWPETSPRDSFLAIGSIARSLGEAGEIEPETDGILLEYGIDSGPFSDEALTCLPQEAPWKIPESELASRRDFRSDCVFTIDPLTARDLDDAVHCKKLEDGFFEVGVHIADVSYFVRPGTALDETATQRATSTYMVQKVIPMLPRRLCEELCSLKPGEDRLTFSVVWKMSDHGEIVDEWKGRGIIRSRVQMAYEHAQDMIDKPNRVWHENELPPISGGATVADISFQVNQLHKFAMCMRRRRFENGALRLDQVKLRFDLDEGAGLPSGYHVLKQRDANKLIEEFMLLANMAVAHHIYGAYTETALLRRHPKPHAKQLEDLVELCKSFGIQFNGTSSKTIQESLAKFPLSSPEREVLVNLTMRPMKNAEYFCTGSVEEDQYGHYALSVPLYTHFTSPIRRYADVVVHRLLAASLGIDQPLNKGPEEIDMIADHCNDRKLAAKVAGDLSNEMFFGIFVRESGPLQANGIVVNVMDQSFDVLMPEIGLVKRVYCKFCPGVKAIKFTKGQRGRPSELKLLWSVNIESSNKIHEEEQVLKVFSQVHVLLTTESETKNSQPFKINAKIIAPNYADLSLANPTNAEHSSVDLPNTTDVRDKLFESEEDRASRESDDVIVESEEEIDIDSSINREIQIEAKDATDSGSEDVIVESTESSNEEI